MGVLANRGPGANCPFCPPLLGAPEYNENTGLNEVLILTCSIVLKISYAINRIYSYVYVCSNFKQLEVALIFQKTLLLFHVTPSSALLNLLFVGFCHNTYNNYYCYSVQHILLFIVMLTLPLNIINYII